MATNALPISAQTQGSPLPGGSPRNNRSSGPAVFDLIDNWQAADAHWWAAIDAISARDDATCDAHMAEFRRLSADWKVVS